MPVTCVRRSTMVSNDVGRTALLLDEIWLASLNLDHLKHADVECMKIRKSKRAYVNAGTQRTDLVSFHSIVILCEKKSIQE